MFLDGRIGSKGKETTCEAYAIVEAKSGVIAKDVHERGEHALGAIMCAGLKADLLIVSKLSRNRSCQ